MLQPPFAILTISGPHFLVAKVQPLAMPCRFRKKEELCCESTFVQNFPLLLMGQFILSLAPGLSVESVRRRTRCKTNDLDDDDWCVSLLLSSVLNFSSSKPA